MCTFQLVERSLKVDESSGLLAGCLIHLNPLLFFAESSTESDAESGTENDSDSDSSGVDVKCKTKTRGSKRTAMSTRPKRKHNKSRSSVLWPISGFAAFC